MKDREREVSRKINLDTFNHYIMLNQIRILNMNEKRCIVIKDYVSPFPDPLILDKGERLSVEEKPCEWPGWIWATTENGKSGWIPKNYMSIEGMKGRMLVKYDATELTAFKGQEFMIEKEESGWAWVVSDSGEQGWIPLENVEIIK